MIKILLCGIMIITGGNCIAQNTLVVTADTAVGLLDTMYGFPEWYPKWVSVALSSDEDEWFLQKNPISNNNGKLKIWVKVKYKSTTWQKKIYKNAYEVHLMEFDFANRKCKTYESAIYRSDGSIIDSYSFDFPEANAIYPDSVLEGVFDTAEKRFKR